MNRDQMLKEMGLGPIWKLRQPPKKKRGAAPEPEPVAPVDDRTAAIAAMGWDELKQAVASCTACELCQTRKQAVLGVGDPDADWLFVGEGPGAEEDERGEPFVGQAGKLLDAMLAAIDLKRGQRVYIANAVKCRPPNNRTPEAGETAACWPFLARQIELIRPKLIVTLGKPAAQTLLQEEVTISRARGVVQDFAGIPLIVTYHPAYLLRNLPDKAKAWEDLCFMRKTMAGLR
ncbi:MAG: uracil-DNA glycosylase [Rhodocyclaceae bacterium]|jgi:DNA polymerase|nr:uracil-DNA glycosylase [Rhodocyclaceae bacterium]